MNQLSGTEGPLGPKVFPGWGSFGLLPPRLQLQPGGDSSSAGGSGSVSLFVCGCSSLQRLRGKEKTEEKLGMEHLRPGFGGPVGPPHLIGTLEGEVST